MKQHLKYTGDFGTFFELVKTMNIQGGGFVYHLDTQKGVAVEAEEWTKSGFFVDTLDTYEKKTASEEAVS